MQKNENQEKQFEVIVSPTDVLEKELDGILGGGTPECPSLVSCTCYGVHNECEGHGGCSGKNKPTCAPGYVWNDVTQDCERIEE